ncbi:TetR family transcriptional regulator [Halopseudomonas sabulinigri]|uniref:TetR family transcriptional regulator n=1 Tax=Halopseudomonas sabulinigri TaxID=472181 RepID=A0A1H1W5F3_9GAMM|nr:TetR family transcriptional regulator [Halopseudomonas sabulinigri]SDS92323.1 TetR/AcrR family transcriptional regulator, acrAB operon repressor [Halopseudomonas sabulinigri]
MVRRTKEEAFETRQRIIDAAQQCFHEKGVSRASLTDIAQAAGVTRGAIYWHFQDKADLLDALFQRIHMPLEALSEATRNPEELHPLELFRELLTEVFRRVESDPTNRQVHEIIFLKCEFTDEPCGPKKHLQAMRQEHDNQVLTTLRLAVARGELPADLDMELALLCLHSFIVGVINQWLMVPTRISLSARAGDVAAAALDMLKLSPAMRTGKAAL